jgi:DcaP outer membrane protein
MSNCAISAVLICLATATSVSAQIPLPPVAPQASEQGAQPQSSFAPAIFSLAEEPSNSPVSGWQPNTAASPGTYPLVAMSQLPPSPPPVFPSSQGTSNNSSAAGSTETQTAPGAPDYQSRNVRLAPALPSYYYERSYYNTYGIGARPLADYAPFGYEREREEQDAPGNPEFVAIGPPPQPTAAQAGNFVVPGMMPGSFLVPGTNTSFRLRGFVRLAFFDDLDPIGVPDAFVPNTIPVPQQHGQNFNMSARISRFALESWTPTDFCDWNVHTFIEGDFFNGPGQAAGGGGNPFRLRHAFFDFGYFRFGQQNSVFMDGSNWPSLVDFQGPNGWINQRQPSGRMTIPLYDGWYWATSVERPFSDITTSGLGTAVQDVPDMATHLRYEGDLGHLQVSGLFRAIGYQPTGDELTRRMGAGISGNLVFHPWAILMGTDPVREDDPSGLTRSRILLQCTWGPGIARYVNDLVGQGLDAQVNPVTGAFDLVNATAWNASYEHWFDKHWLTNFTYSQAIADNNPDQPGTTYNRGQYLAGSLWWIPIPRLSIGIEYLWGQRLDLDGERAMAQRIDGLFQYNF